MTERPSLEGPTAKLMRAHAHLERLYSERNVFVNQEPQAQTLTSEVESERITEDARHVTFVWRVHFNRYPSAEWGLILGDFVHNLRSALDHLIWQLVLLSGNEGSRDNQFPICATGTRYWCSRKDGTPSVRDRCLRGVDEQYRARIDQVQPYRRPDGPRRSPLTALVALSNADKHQVVQAAFVAPLEVTVDNFDFTAPAGPPGEGIANIEVDHSPLHEGAEVIRASVVVPGPDTHVNVNANIPVGIAFGEAGVRDEGLGLIYGFVRDFLRGMAPIFGEEWEQLSLGASTEIDHV